MIDKKNETTRTGGTLHYDMQTAVFIKAFNYATFLT